MKIVWNPALARSPEKFISLSKPLKVLDRVFAPTRDELVLASEATAEELVGAHSEDYVRKVLSLQAPDGFLEFDGSNLPHILAANGVMIRAAKEALETPGVAVFAPVSGFHHAAYADGYGYCTFNGLLVAAAALNPGREAPRVLVIDGDGHEGDGTDDIIGRRIEKFARVGNCTRMTRSTWRARIVAAMARDWDLVIYQAGADAHVEDPYGVGYLTDEGWDARDELVFTTAAERATPIVFNLAGGYNGLKTIDLHARTVQAARFGAAQARRSASLYRAATAKLEPWEKTLSDGPVVEDIVNDRGLPERGSADGVVG